MCIRHIKCGINKNLQKEQGIGIKIPLESESTQPWSVDPSFLYLESNIRLGNLDDSGCCDDRDRGIVIGMPRKEVRGH